jgi:hemerythrin
MQQIKWSEEYSVGIPEMDAQHRQLMELLGALAKFASSGGVVDPRTAIGEMKRQAEQHLQEEELMLSIRGYPEYARHKAEHDAYRAKAAALEAQSGRRDFGTRITTFLTEWWSNHILHSAQEYARYFESHPGVPADAGGEEPGEL